MQYGPRSPYRMNPFRRLRCENIDIVLKVGNGQHNLTVSLAYDADNCLREVCFVGRGKVGHGVDEMLHELGIQLSRAIQHRNPNMSLYPASLTRMENPL
jgi:hypothetical protein